MSIRNVVKVMNFHSLLRVDKSRSQAKKCQEVEGVLNDMIDNIVNNRNVILDYSTLRVGADRPVLEIFIGSDMGFCSNLNSLVKKQIAESNEKVEQIIIGRKLHSAVTDQTVLYLSQEEYMADSSPVMNRLEVAVRNKQYSRIKVIYNHYYSSTEVDLIERQIFPVKAMDRNDRDRITKKRRDDMYKEDFACESDIDALLVNLVVMYLKYSMEIAVSISYAAENISRQNVTTESLQRIDERTETQLRKDRRADKDKKFAKVLDDYTKIRHY